MAVEDWPPPEAFPDRLAKLRRVLGVSNPQIAEATGVGTDTVSKWAAGQVPQGLKLTSLARFLGVSPDYLLEGRIEPGRPEKPIIPPKPPRKPYPPTAPGKPLRHSK